MPSISARPSMPTRERALDRVVAAAATYRITRDPAYLADDTLAAALCQLLHEGLTLRDVAALLPQPSLTEEELLDCVRMHVIPQLAHVAIAIKEASHV